MNLIFYIISIPFIFYLIFPGTIILLSLFRKVKMNKKYGDNTSIAFIITAYKKLSLAQYCVDSILKQKEKNYHIYLVADACKDSLHLTSKYLSILRPESDLNSKVRSMKFAFDRLHKNHTHVCVLDPDNLIKSNFTEEIKYFIQCGYNVVQGRRTAKNTDSIFAKLDVLGESYYNYLARYCMFKLGSSASIAGSGMVLTVGLFKNYFGSKIIKEKFNQIILGEDKILQNYLVSKGEQIAFSRDAIIYDEKLNSGSQAERQRTRWINTYFQNIKESLNMLFNSLVRLNWNSFLFSIMSISPPLFLLLFISILLFSISILIDQKFAIFLFILIFIFISNFFLIWKLAKVPNKVISSFWLIPLFLFKQFKALLSIGKSKNDFLTTSSSKAISIDNVRE